MASSYAYRAGASTPNIPGRETAWDVWSLPVSSACRASQAEERQRVDGRGCSGRRVKTSGEGVARVEQCSGVDAAEQRVQVDVPERRHQRVGDGVGSAGETRDRGVDVLDPVAEVEGVKDRAHRRKVRGTGVGIRGDTCDGELRAGQAQQVGHILITDDASDLGGAGTGAVEDVELLRRQRDREAAKGFHNDGRATADLQQRWNANGLGDWIKALGPARKGGVEGGVADAEGVG